MRVLQRRPANQVDILERGRYLRVFGAANDLGLVEVENRGSIAAPELRFSMRAGSRSVSTRQTVEGLLRRMLGLDFDPKQVQKLTTAIPSLRAAAAALRGMRPPRFASLFETFVNVVIFQQLSLAAGVAIVGRVVRRFGPRLEHDGRWFYGFPSADAIITARQSELLACGVSSRKCAVLKRIGLAITSCELDEERLASMPTPSALEYLQELPGIGPWSAALVLLRGMGRLDAFPPGDVGAMRELSALLRITRGASLDRVIERAGDLRGYVYFCGLGTSLVRQGLIHAA